MTKEAQIEDSFIKKLEDLKYTYRKDIQGKNALERNFREKFETLNRVKLTDNEFERLKTDIINPDVFYASKLLRTRNYFQREDGTPLHYTLVNIKDWCKNEYEVINQLRINTENSNHRYDVIILINGIPIVQIELKTLEISPRKAMQQIVDYKNENFADVKLLATGGINLNNVEEYAKTQVDAIVTSSIYSCGMANLGSKISLI